MHRHFIAVLRFCLLVLVMVGTIFPTQSTVYALTTLTVQPLTWNIVGLDSNNVNVGPNDFPVGARVCNSGSEAATNITAAFNWDSAGAYINLRSGTLTSINLGTLNAGTCADAYFEVQVTRNASAYDHTRRYHIEVTAGNVTGTISTPTPREIYVEHLVSQNRNAVTDVQLNGVSIAPGGTMTLMIGQTYTIKLVGFTATQGYEQIEYFINFPNTIFQILSVSSTFDADSSPTVGPSPIDKLYGDNCVWDNDPNSPTYRACLSTGKTGGNVTTTYQVKILQVPGAPLINPQPLSTLIYDFSGSSYHYNSDFGVSTRYAYIVNASISKAFSPKTITPGSTSTLTFSVTNPGTSAMTGVNFSDSLPTGMTIASSAVTFSGCGTPSPSSLTVGATSLSFSNITVAGLGTCTVAVTVTASANGTYNNTSGNLFINGSIDTGSFATDSLVVSSQPTPPSSCTTPVTLASWTMPTSGQGSGGPPPPYTTKATDVSTATASAVLTAAGSQSTNTAGVTTNAWGITDAWPSVAGAPGATAAPYFDLVVDTSNYGGVRITFDRDLEAPGDWGNATNSVYVYSSADGGAFSAATAIATTKGAWQTGATAAATTGTSTTRFTIHADTRNGAKATSITYLDNMVITGCPRPTVPTLSKSFLPTTISLGSASTLTFTFSNPNSTALSEISFSDTLPTGLVVNTPNGVSSISCTSGSVVTTPAITATAGTSTISMNGLQLSANASCSFSVSVKGNTAGSYTNISSSITSTSSGPNTTTTGYGTSSLTVVAPPVINKSFAANPILTGGSTTLSFTISNPNTSTALSGVSFTDTLPAGLAIAATPNLVNSCGGTATAAAGSSSISLTGVSLPAGESCTLTVSVTGNPAGLKNNSVTVNSTNGGTGNTSTASVLVKDATPAMTLLKQVGPTASGPWTSFLSINTNTTIYYRFTVENIGDVDLNAVDVTDPPGGSAINCSWVDGDGTPLTAPFTLFKPASGNNKHIATCTISVTTNATVGSYPNTAQASGTNGITVTDDSIATYANPRLTIVKTATPTSFTTAGNTISYSYLVTNDGFVPLLGPVTLADDKTTNESCPAVNTVGDLDDWLDVNESLTCTSSYTIAAGDVTAGSVTNIASASASGTTSATDSETVYLAGLTIDKDTTTPSVDVNGNIVYNIVVVNSGQAALTNFQVSDVLPVFGGTSAVVSVTAPGYAVNGSYTGIAPNTNLLAGTDTLAAGATATITITVDLVNATVGTYDNTATVSTTQTGSIDDDGLVAGDPGTPNVGADPETDEDVVVFAQPDLTVTKTNNTPNGVVGVNGTFQWTITASNGATAGTAAFASGNTILSDALPGVAAYYPQGTLTITNGATAPTGTINCSITGTALSCVANGAVTLPASASFSVTLNVTPTAAGSLANTATIDPNGVVNESNEANNTGSNTVSAVSVAKTIASTSEPSTGFVSGFERVVVGEVIRYRLTTSLPEGTWTNVQITDAIETGIQFLNDGTAAISYVCDGTCTNSTFTIAPAVFTSSTDPTFNLGTVTNPDSDSNPEALVVEFNALVLNMASNVAGGVTKNNTYTISFNGTPITSPAVGVRIAEPSITDLAKTVSPAAGPYYPGDTITYTLAYSNGSTGVTRATAYDVFLTDTLSTNLDLQSVSVTAPTGAAVTDTSTTGVAGVVRILVDQLVPAVDIASGPTGVTVTVTAQIVNSAVAGTLTNTASLTYTSLPGGVTTGDTNGTCPNVTGSCLPAGGTSGAQTGERNGTGGAVNTYNDTSTVNITVTPVADLSLTKTVKTATPMVGSDVTFTVTVANAGSSTATNVSVSDVLPAGLTYVSSTPSQGTYNDATGVWSVGSINSGSSATLDIVATVTSTGALTNTAQVSASDQLDPDSTPNNNNVNEDDQASVTVTPVATGVISDFVWNDLDGDGVQDGGLEIGLSGVRVYVDLDGDNTYDAGEPTGTTDGTGNYTISGLVAGTYDVRVDTTTLPAGYTETFDLDGGNDNEASVTLTSGQVRDDVDFGYQEQIPELTTVKSETSSGPYVLGDTITYDVVVTNTGTTTLTNVVVSDPNLIPNSVTCAGVAPLGTCTLTGIYTVTQADVDTGSFSNTGSVTDDDVCPAAGTDTCEDTVTVNFVQTPAITIVKSSNATGTNAVGDTITYTYEIKNTGNVTLTNVNMTDAHVGLSAISCTPAQGSTLSPDSTMTCTATYTVTQADVDAGQIDNTGVVTGTPPTGPDVTANNFLSEPLAQNPSLTLVKSETSTGVYAVNDTITYSVVATNNGNTTLTNVVVSDLKLTPNSVSCASVAPLGTCVLSGSYTVTQADVDAGSFTNTGSVTDDAVCPAAGSATCEDTVTITFSQKPALTIVKSETSAGPYLVGDAISYDIVVTNTGDITLTNILISDPDLTPNSTTCANVAPGGTCTLSGVYTVTQTDIDAGSFTNTGSVTDDNLCPAAGAAICEDTVIVNFPQSPDLTIAKSETSTGPYAVGGMISYSVVVTNTGNITLTNVVVSDPALTPASTTCTTLAPLDTCTLLGTYTVQQVDVSAGSFTNTASVTDDDVCPPAGAVTCQDSVTVSLASAQVVDPALSKAGSPTQASVGDTVTFTLVVTNQGNTPAPNVVVTDVLPSIFDVTAVNVTGAPLGTLVSVTPPIGTGTAPYTVVVTLGDNLGVTDVVTIQIVTTVNAQGNPPITNTATLTTPALTDVVANNADSVTITIRNSQAVTGSVLPATGFAPNVVTDMSNVPSETYAPADGVTVEIPNLSVKIPVVGVPRKNGTWNVAWLGNQAGWLEGSAFPSWSGNSVLTGHVYLSNGLPGPFVNIGKLKYGDKIILHAYGQKYTFEVRTNQVVEPNDGSVMKHEEKSWVTLVTCKEYDEKTNTYRKRVVVRAVLVSVAWE